MPLLDSLLATLTQFLRRLGGRIRLTDLLMLQDWSPQKSYTDLLAKEKAERAANRVGNHALEPADEEDPGLLPPSTATPKAGRIWQHEDDAWGDPGLCGATHGHQLLDLMAL